MKVTFHLPQGNTFTYTMEDVDVDMSISEARDLAISDVTEILEKSPISITYSIEK
jgi:hypothetical protein